MFLSGKNITILLATKYEFTLFCGTTSVYL
jgi:hypothetical protein